MSMFAQATALMSDGVPLRQVALRLGVPEDLVMAMASMANPKARTAGVTSPAPSPCGGCPAASACSGTCAPFGPAA